MTKIKKAIKVCALVCVLLLAGIGIGISGGVPLDLSRKERERELFDIEMVEDYNEDSSTNQDYPKST